MSLKFYGNVLTRNSKICLLRFFDRRFKKAFFFPARERGKKFSVNGSNIKTSSALAQAFSASIQKLTFDLTKL